MNRDREFLGQMAQLRQGAAAIAHVVFRMDFQPAHVACILQDVRKMLRFVSDTSGGREGLSGVQHISDPE